METRRIKQKKPNDEQSDKEKAEAAAATAATGWKIELDPPPFAPEQKKTRRYRQLAPLREGWRSAPCGKPYDDRFPTRGHTGRRAEEDMWITRKKTHCCCRLSWREQRVSQPGKGHLCFLSPV